MISIRKHSAAPLCRGLLGLTVLLASVVAASAQTDAAVIYGVTALDVAPAAAADGVALLKQYRDKALKQAGNTGVTLLQEADRPNRFVIYEAWKDQAPYDANEKAAHSGELRDKLKSMGAAPYDRRDYHVISVGPAQTAAGAAGGDVVFMQLHLDVFPPGIEPTLAAARA